MARSSYVEPSALGLVLAALQPANRLVFEVMLATGLRVGDVLRLTTAQIERQRFTVREQKTGKTRRVVDSRQAAVADFGTGWPLLRLRGPQRLAQASYPASGVEGLRPLRPGSSSIAGLCQKERFRHTAPARSTRWTSTAAPATLTRCAKS